MSKKNPHHTAEGLNAESLVRRMKDWEVFNMAEADNHERKDLEQWLDENKPTKIQPSQGIGWLAVLSPTSQKEDQTLFQGNNLSKIGHDL